MWNHILMHKDRRGVSLRIGASVFVAFVTGLFTYGAAAGLLGPGILSLLIAVLSGSLTGIWTHRSNILRLDPEADTRGLCLFSAIFAVIALVQLARITVFMVFPSLPQYSTLPFSDWEVRHAC